MNNIMGMVAVFIGIAIMLSVGITILSNASAGLDCSDIKGYNSDASAATGWGKICLDAAAQAQAGYQLMVVALIVIAAVIILIVVRML